MNTSLLLQMAADGIPDRIAVGSKSNGLAYAQLAAAAARTADWLDAHTAERVAYLGLNSPAFPITLFASGMAGRAFVPVNYRLPDASLRKLLARTAPSLVVVDEEFLPRVGGIDGVEVISRQQLLEIARIGPAPEIPAGSDAADIALMLFTSGTTGEPKAAILRHQHLTSYVVQTVDFMGADENEAILVSVPPYHIAGVSSLLTSIYGGRRVVQLEAFSPASWIDLANAEQITHAMVVPTMLGRIVEELERSGKRLPSLRSLAYGGGRMPVSVIRRAIELMPWVDFVNAYGLTETSSTITVLGPDDHRAAYASEDPAVIERLGSVGRALPSVIIEIRDERGVPVAPGILGEIWVRGEQVSGEYVGRKAIQDDGWLRTNDFGRIDAAGYLFVEGRLDDVIVRGGENISPGEIEEVLRSHEVVRDAAVVGVPDDEWGERIAAVVVAEGASEDELKAFVRTRLRSTKVPETIEFRSELPYNDMGKLLRRELRQQLAGSSAVGGTK